MNAKQTQFLKILSTGDKTAPEICKELKIEPIDKEILGVYYRDLLDFIQWPMEDENDFDDKFSIFTPNDNPDEDVFSLTSLGETFVSDLIKGKQQNHLAIVGVFVGIIGVIVTIILSLVL